MYIGVDYEQQPQPRFIPFGMYRTRSADFDYVEEEDAILRRD